MMARSPARAGAVCVWRAPHAAHIQLTESVAEPDDALRLQMLGAITGWLRWQLAEDDTQRARYLGPDCELCQPDTGWTIMQKGLL